MLLGVRPLELCYLVSDHWNYETWYHHTIGTILLGIRQLELFYLVSDHWNYATWYQTIGTFLLGIITP